MTLEVRWEGVRPVALVVRGPVAEPVYVARILGSDLQHGFIRAFLGRSTLTVDDMEEITVPVAQLTRGEVLEIREGIAPDRLGPYDRFVIWDGKCAQRVEIAYALHALQRGGALPAK